MKLMGELLVAMKMAEMWRGHENDNSVCEFVRNHGNYLFESLSLLDQLACCTGQNCGCHGVTKREVAENLKDAESIVADAERYRWLRGVNSDHIQGCAPFAVVIDDEDGGTWVGSDLDSAIDLARTKASAGGGK